MTGAMLFPVSVSGGAGICTGSQYPNCRRYGCEGSGTSESAGPCLALSLLVPGSSAGEVLGVQGHQRAAAANNE